MNYEIALDLVGDVTGIVGAITGPAALVLAWISYRRSQQFKRLDLRLELRKQVSGLRAVVEALPELSERTRLSRTAVLAAMGLSQSGPFLSFKAAWESDLKAAQDLARELPDADETYQRLKHQDLETKLVEVHALATRAAGLRDKYLASLASDTKNREHIRADVRARPRES
jgi:hypothetical protein